MAQKSQGFFARMRRRFYVLVVLGVLILLAILWLRCNGGGGIGPGGGGSGVMGGNGDGQNNNPSTPINANDPNSNIGAGSIRHRFFVLRFEEDKHDPRQVRAAFARLLLPSGDTVDIEGRVEGTNEASITKYYEELEATLKRVRGMPAFSSIGQIYLEDYVNRDGNKIFSNAFRNKHTQLVTAIFAKAEWRSSNEVNDLINGR